MKPKIRILAHNIRSLWNVGSLFRTSDCFAVEKVYLSGYTATPPRREITKTALGAEEWIAWEQIDDVRELIDQLKSDNWHTVALEQAPDAVAVHEFSPTEKVLLMIGHEVTGVDEELLELADTTIEIPMFGKKESLNVSVATGIALSHMRNIDE